MVLIKKLKKKLFKNTVRGYIFCLYFLFFVHMAFKKKESNDYSKLQESGSVVINR